MCIYKMCLQIIYLINICDTHQPANPRLINFFKPILFMASNSSSGFRRSISHFFTATKILPRGWEKKNKRTIWTWVSSKRKKGSLFSPCICRLSPACIFRETSTKATSHADISRWLTRPLCRSSGLSSRLSDFCWLPSLLCLHPLLPPSADCCQLPFSVFLRQLTFCPFSDLPFLVHFRSRGGYLAQPFEWVSRQSRQRDSLTGVHTHTPNSTNGHRVSHM